MRWRRDAFQEGWERIIMLRVVTRGWVLLGYVGHWSREVECVMETPAYGQLQMQLVDVCQQNPYDCVANILLNYLRIVATVQWWTTGHSRRVHFG